MTGLALCSFLECHRTGHAERVFVRVHIVVRTEGQRDFHVDHWVASQNTGVQGFAHAFFHRRDEFARNHTALDGVDELEAFALFLWFQGQNT
jgi:hypothetical protein